MGGGGLDTSHLTFGEYIADLVETEGLAVAGVAGGISVMALGARPAEAINFGAIVALSHSLGSTLLTFAGKYAKLNSYLGTYGAELDPNDFVATGLMTGVLIYYSAGLRGPNLYKAMAVGGVAGVLGPQVASAIHSLALGGKTGKDYSASQSN